MNSKIVELMGKPTRDMAWLKSALQSAVELELATLPPYLCGLWALQDRSSDPARQILSIAKQEMGHFGLACNMLAAIGGKPDIMGGYSQIEYPGRLPGGVKPKCDSTFFPCDQDFQVILGFPDFKAFALMSMQIEYPEDPVPKPALLDATAETFPSIGEFYNAVFEAFKWNDGTFKYQVTNQRQGALGIFVVDGLPKAIAALQRIQQEGEGSSKDPFYAPNKLSHFYAFGELYFAKRYVYNSANKTGYWTGDTVSIPAVYEMTPVPKNGYPKPPSEVIECDKIFTTMLKQLDAAWGAGGDAALNDAIDSMVTLGEKATDLLKKKIPREDGLGIYGPQFKIYAMAEPPMTGGGKDPSTPGGGDTLNVSFAKDILPLFRPIDIDHMKRRKVLLEDYKYMSDASGDHSHAQAVLDVLKNQEMPPGGPYWPQDKLDLFAKWMTDGYQP
jgi:hypothetical protein